MKRFSVLLVVATVLTSLALVSCGEDDETTTTSASVDTTVTSTVAEETTTITSKPMASTEFDYNEGADWESIKERVGETVVVIGTVVAVQGGETESPALDGSDQIQIYLGSVEMLDEPLNPQNRFVVAIPPDSLSEFPYLVNLQATEAGLVILMGGGVKATGELYVNEYGGAGILCTEKDQLLFRERDGWVQ